MTDSNSNSDAKLLQTDFRLCEECQKLHTGFTTCPQCSTKLTLIDHTFFLGKSFGRYVIEKVLGVGGMGVVFQGVHAKLGKKVAIKIFIPNEKDDTFEKRFLREARILAGLKHPNIIEVFDFDISEWGPPFYVMEFLQGSSLRREIEKYDNGLPYDVFAAYLDPIIHGLGHAHKQGIVHRDLKPDNIFLEEIEGRKVLKILDFGIAKSTTDMDEGTHLTSTQAVLGTPYYLAPEQILNKNIGPHTDQYALALIVAEMLSGEVIRSGKSIGEILYKDVHTPIQVESLNQKKIPGNVKQALVKATMPEPEKRYPDIESFGNAVFSALDISYSEPNVTAGIKTEVTIKPSKLIPSLEKTFMSIEEEVEQEARLKKEKKRKKRRRRVSITFLLILLAFSAGAFYYQNPFGWFSPGEFPPGWFPLQKPKPVPKKIIKKKPPIINLVKEIGVPKEVESILTYRGSTFTFNKPDGVILINLTNPVEPQLIPFGDNTFLGGLKDGNIALMDNFTITSQDFMAGNDTTLARLHNPVPGKRFKIDPAGKFLAAHQDTSLKLYQLSEEKLKIVKDLALSQNNTGPIMEISEHYLALTNNGSIMAYRLDSGEAVLNQSLDVVEGVGPVAILEGKHLLATGYGNKRIAVFDLVSRKKIADINEPEKTLALNFLADSEVLVIAKPGRILFRRIGQNVSKEYKETGLTVTDIKSTPQGLVLLDKKDNVIKIFSYKISKF